MKSYLSLIPISAKVHRRQNRMTVWCIIISVLLVTTIFTVADMMIRTESAELLDKHGNWHIQLENISEAIADKLSQRTDVVAVGWAESFNTNAEKPYYIGSKIAALYGTDETYISKLVNALEDGDYPKSDDEVMLNDSAKLALGVQIGDKVNVQTPAGDFEFTVVGFGSDDKKYYQGQLFMVATYMTRRAYTEIMELNGIETNPVCYVEFNSAAKAAAAIPEIQQQFGLTEGSISENTGVMGIAGQSSNDSMKSIYGMAAALFVLVLLAGVLMISGSMNSNVSQRTKFFGMLRCIGASRQQIIQYVRLEALNWCKTAVPIGLISGTLISWGVCALLRYGIGGEFSATPVFKLSPVGLISGIVVGVITVLLAAQAPAKSAAKVSPVAAVSGNSDSKASVQHSLKISLGRVERTLGVHHATASKKNWALMTASFSLSIVLFLCFTVGLDFGRELMPTMRSWTPDICLNGYSNSLVLSPDLKNELSAIDGVEQVFGSSYLEELPATSSNQKVNHVNLASYSSYLLDSAKDSLVQGDLTAVYGDSDKVMTVSNKDNPIRVGDVIQINGNEVEIVCSISSGLWPSEYSIICSEETFERLTGEKNYSIVGIQLGKDATDDTVLQISKLTAQDVIFSDMRDSNQEDCATYMAIQFVLFSFLAIIAMITLFNMINSISMSVTARIKQYGAMRAVGMDGRQLTRMISAEAATYAISGLVVGCGAGIVLSRLLYIRLLTRYFGIGWSLPIGLIGIIVLFDAASAMIAIYAPAKRIRSMAVTDTINEL
jgi:putative ABC transport system permease protein